MHQKILITGGAGFIGSAVVRQYIAQTEVTVVNIDKLTYAGNMESLADAIHHPRHIFERADICDRREMERLFCEHQPDAIMHLAAESHVDRSIDGPAEFIDTNIVGTYTLLEVARDYWNQLEGERRARFRFHHVSTDEVYGSLGETGYFTEETAYRPNSPYSASKAASDHLVRAWHTTYGLPAVITNCSNNYGPYQFPEKLIPLMILNAVEARPLPIYGRGENIRDWLYVDDHACALRLVLERGEPGQTYNIGGNNEKTNLEIVHTLCDILEELHPPFTANDIPFTDYRSLITHVIDRPGHDKRYAIDASKITRHLGWRPQETFETGLRKTVMWYLENGEWLHCVWRSGNRNDRLRFAGAG